MKRYLIPTAAVAVLLVGCGMHSRYNPGDQYGDRVTTDKKALAANLQSGGGSATAEEAKFLAWGKDLFNNTDLGKNGQSCNSCHPGGASSGGEARIPKKMGHGPYALPIPSLVGASSRFPKYKVPNGKVISLQQMDNNCIRMFMNGKRLPLDSPESIALAAYVTSLSKGEDIDISSGSKR